MSLISGFEQRLERAVEGFFTRIFKSGVHPVEIGKRVLRVMEDGKTVALRRSYVPNIFEITLSPKDHGRLESIESKLIEELEVFVGEAARQRDWAMADSPRVGFMIDNDLHPGEFRVAAQAVSLGAAPAPERDTVPPGADYSDATPVLMLLADGTPVKTVEIVDSIMVGRQADNDLVIADRSVSRQHAEITFTDGSCTVRDLGSTNGTKVNGTPISADHHLADGDEIEFGSTHAEFRLT